MKADWTADDIPSDKDRIVVVTGGNSGLGLRSAEALARSGARVLIAARNVEKAEAARQSVARLATGPEPEVVTLDLMSLASVADAAAEISSRVPRVDVLLNNAGIMALPKAETADGFESQLGTNHLGHFALTGQLLPLLLAAPAPRVITVSSNAHKFGTLNLDDLNFETRRYGKWRAYGQSKLADLVFALELNRQAAKVESGLISVAAHPGYALTHLAERSRKSTKMNPFNLLSNLGDMIIAQPDTDGAKPQLYASTMAGVHGGEYFGPSGPGELRGGPVRVKPRSKATNAETGARLWEESIRLTGIKYDWA